MFERTKALYDILTNPSRYRNEDEEVSLDETTDPQTWRDESKPTWTERLASRKHQFIAFGFVGLILLGIIAAYSRTYIPELYGNPLVREAVKWGLVVPAAFLSGVKWLRGKLRQVDWLVLILPEGGIGFYIGDLNEDSTGNTIFHPLKGFDFMGLRGQKLTLGDLGNDFARNFAKQGRDADEPASIRIEDGLYAKRDTFLGSVAGVLTGGLEVDEFGRESDLYTTPPSTVDEDRYRKLRNTLERVTDQNTELQNKLEAVSEQRDYWKQEAKKEREEIRKEIIDTHGELAEAGFTPRSQPQQNRAQAPAGASDYDFLEDDQ